MVSIIVPVYNVQDYLKDCLESIRKQTYKDLEILLINDGSKDKSGEICDQYSKIDSRIRVFHKNNGGLSSARNMGLNNIKGEYVCFIDSDDIIDNMFIEKLFQIMIKYNVDMVKSNFYKKDQDKIKDSKKVKLFSPEEACYDFLFTKYSLRKAMKSTSTDALYKREVFKNIRYKEGIINEDTQIFPNIIFECNRIAYYDRSMYYYRENENGIMHSKINKKKIESLNIWKEIYTTVNEKSKLGYGVIAQWVINLIYSYWETYQIENIKEKEEYQKLIKKVFLENKKLFYAEKIALKIKIGIKIFDICPRFFYLINDYFHLIY
ncbi:glycosyltransferase family 2 protein [Faecalibacillus intestinalis]|uniref:glycosyltransferase family 2 protein n=1 Tax=Faecalibacillus intestinalis TaxID=1982626 RepID=UPI003AB2C8E0